MVALLRSVKGCVKKCFKEDDCSVEREWDYLHFIQIRNA